MKKTTGLLLCLCLAMAIGAWAQDALLVNGAGATFPYPIYSKWFDEYHKAHAKVQINYQSVGSGAGIRQLLSGTVDFGASDGPMTDEQLGQAKIPVLHFPTVLGAVVPTYNIPGVSDSGVNLPANDIVVVHRSDGSGTTYIWTDYLSKVSDAWKTKVGKGASPSWPVGLGGKGNEGVSGLVKETPNSIGYVELIYAIQNKMPYGRVRNAGGAFVKADLNGVSAAAAAAAKSMPDDFRVSITNADGKTAYPISSFTWLLIPTKISDASKRDALKGFLKWMVTDGQKFAEPLAYAKLPKEVVEKETKAIAKIE